MLLSTCKSCRASIGWLKTKAGKNMPVNPDLVKIFPSNQGNITVVTPKGEIVKGFEADEEVLAEYTPVTGYISHFATCKDADRHRRK